MSHDDLLRIKVWGIKIVFDLSRIQCLAQWFYTTREFKCWQGLKPHYGTFHVQVIGGDFHQVTVGIQQFWHRHKNSFDSNFVLESRKYSSIQSWWFWISPWVFTRKSQMDRMAMKFIFRGWSMAIQSVLVHCTYIGQGVWRLPKLDR